MVVFSFFGNIMLANMLVAFLANQFNNIMKKAKYYTLKMQYNLTKTLRPTGLDSVYAMPYFMNAAFMPLYLLMAKEGNLRSSLNRLLRMFIHILNVFTPQFIFHLVVLLAMVLVQYCSISFTIISQLRKSIVSIVYLLVWILVGLPFLLKLMILDLYFVCNQMMSFTDSKDKDLYTILLTDEDRIGLSTIC